MNFHQSFCETHRQLNRVTVFSLFSVIFCEGEQCTLLNVTIISSLSSSHARKMMLMMPICHGVNTHRNRCVTFLPFCRSVVLPLCSVCRSCFQSISSSQPIGCSEQLKCLVSTLVVLSCLCLYVSMFDVLCFDVSGCRSFFLLSRSFSLFLLWRLDDQCEVIHSLMYREVKSWHKREQEFHVKQFAVLFSCLHWRDSWKHGTYT